MPILKLEPTCKDYLWGGTKLKSEFHKSCSTDVLAESWELSFHSDGKSVIKEGTFAGMTLWEYVEWEGKKVLGKNCMQFEDFPILIKFIDAKENLSIQVHPGDEYALSNEGQYGKTEMWYVVSCSDEAYIYYGFKEQIEREEFEERINNDTLLEVLNKVPVKKGDVFFIEAGTIHAIGKDIVIAEIQQNSNVTYRVYDYGRRDANGQLRDLHIEKALAVTKRNPKVRSDSFDPHLGVCRYFVVDKFVLDGKFMRKMQGRVDEASFLHMLIIEGSGQIKTPDEKALQMPNSGCVAFEKGDSLLLTAGLGEFEITGSCEVLMTTIPDTVLAPTLA